MCWQELVSQQASDQVKVITQLVQARKLSATTENIRHLRHAIAQENGSGLWQSILQDNRFYSGGGFKQLFFNEYNQGFDLQSTQQLLKNSGLDFIGFADLDKVIKELEAKKLWKLLESSKQEYMTKKNVMGFYYVARII